MSDPNAVDTQLAPPAPTERFVIGIDQSVIDQEVQDLDAEGLINYWSTFEPTSERPYPSHLSAAPTAPERHAVDDMAAVLAGSKPATLFRLLQRDVENPLFLDLLNKAYMRADLTVREVTRDGGATICLIGNPESVEAIADQYEALPASEGQRSDEFHIAVGTALGYPEEIIDGYLHRDSSA